jgi:exosortase/archaeosortase family protein
VQGNTFQLGPSRIQIVGECTPLMPTLVLAAAIAAYPTTRRAQVLGILGGGLVIWAFNLFRIGTLMAVIAWWPASFDFIHMYLWQTISLLVVLLVFLLWLRLFRERPEPR